MKRILLIGAGHAHLTILRGLKKEALASARLALVAPRASQIYSGMLPGVIAGHYRRDEAEIDVARLAGAVSAEFIQGEVVKLDPAQKLAGSPTEPSSSTTRRRSTSARSRIAPSRAPNSRFR